MLLSVATGRSRIGAALLLTATKKLVQFAYKSCLTVSDAEMPLLSICREWRLWTPTPTPIAIASIAASTITAITVVLVFMVSGAQLTARHLHLQLGCADLLICAFKGP